jgi:hypothetical protein
MRERFEVISYLWMFLFKDLGKDKEALHICEDASEHDPAVGALSGR